MSDGNLGPIWISPILSHMTQFSSLKLRIAWDPLRTECLAWFPLSVFITQTQFGLSESDENWKQGFDVFCFSKSNSVAIFVKWKTSWSPQLVYCHVSLILPLQICPFLFLTTTTPNPTPPQHHHTNPAPSQQTQRRSTPPKHQPTNPASTTNSAPIQNTETPTHQPSADPHRQNTNPPTQRRQQTQR